MIQVNIKVVDVMEKLKKGAIKHLFQVKIISLEMLYLKLAKN